MRRLYLSATLLLFACGGPAGPTSPDGGHTGDAVCGDGVVQAGESCDGDCPTSCDDRVACTIDGTAGSSASCDLACTHAPVEECVDHDGCCPGACAGRDSDCSSSCGDGHVDPGETCDGDCPTSCDDAVACTSDQLVGSASTCSAACTHDPVSACVDADGCCPSLCTALTDSDCSASCGNGVVEDGEVCDGDCPASCDDGVACTSDQLVGSAASCSASCSSSAVTACADGDGCCAPGCTAVDDDDCSPSCGNGTVEPPESCDGDCPESCDDGLACTTDALAGSAATCSAACSHVAVTACADGDGCCAPGCTAVNDDDCSPSCGNGVVEDGEACDGACPTDCDDSVACTRDAIVGSAATCSATCSHSPISACASGDGCCPSGCAYPADVDCPAPACSSSADGCCHPGPEGSTLDPDCANLNCDWPALAATIALDDPSLLRGSESALPATSAVAMAWSPHGLALAWGVRATPVPSGAVVVFEIRGADGALTVGPLRLSGADGVDSAGAVGPSALAYDPATDRFLFAAFGHASGGGGGLYYLEIDPTGAVVRSASHASMSQVRSLFAAPSPGGWVVAMGESSGTTPQSIETRRWDTGVRPAIVDHLTGSGHAGLATDGAGEIFAAMPASAPATELQGWVGPAGALRAGALATGTDVNAYALPTIFDGEQYITVWFGPGAAWGSMSVSAGWTDPATTTGTWAVPTAVSAYSIEAESAAWTGRYVIVGLATQRSESTDPSHASLLYVLPDDGTGTTRPRTGSHLQQGLDGMNAGIATRVARAGDRVAATWLRQPLNQPFLRYVDCP